MTKKSGSKKSSTSKQNMVSEALGDLEREIKTLNSEKKKLADHINKIDLNLESSREKERELQEKIARLAEKEANLKQKKKKISSDTEELADRLSKIEKIKSELGDI